MIHKILKYITENDMLKANDRVIVGVSGGADSVCLLFTLMEIRREIPLTLVAVHVEHGIRGADSEEDARYVQQLCQEYDIPFRKYCCLLYTSFYQKEIEAGNRNAFTRSSTLNSPAFKDNFNGEWATAFEDALSRAYSEYTPSIAEGTQIRETIGIALSKALSDQMEVEPAMQEAEAEIERILE